MFSAVHVLINRRYSKTSVSLHSAENLYLTLKPFALHHSQCLTEENEKIGHGYESKLL